MTKNVISNLGIYLVFGLLVGMTLGNSALGVLGGLLLHLTINSIYFNNSTVDKAGSVR